MHVYSDVCYLKSLGEFGFPYNFASAGGGVLKRKIPEFNACDAMGPYPFFACKDWSRLRADIESARDDFVSVGLVADPHGRFDISMLNECFDHVMKFKQHYIIDLETPLEQLGSSNRRKKARRALKKIEVSLVGNPEAFIDDWSVLYDVLIKRHEITGVRAFSRDSFIKQFSLPGVEVIKAMSDGEVIGALVMFWHGDVVCGHLCALSEKGYQLDATLALDWFSFEHYAGKARLLDLGGGLSLSEAGSGLDAYKRGWATRTIPVNFCGRILNHDLYKEITMAKGKGGTNYFPAYREGEFSSEKLNKESA